MNDVARRAIGDLAEQLAEGVVLAIDHADQLVLGVARVVRRLGVDLECDLRLHAVGDARVELAERLAQLPLDAAVAAVEARLPGRRLRRADSHGDLLRSLGGADGDRLVEGGVELTVRLVESAAVSGHVLRTPGLRFCFN